MIFTYEELAPLTVSHYVRKQWLYSEGNIYTHANVTVIPPMLQCEINSKN